MRFGAMRTDSFCVVDDDLCVRSDVSGRCILKLNVCGEKGFSHGRIVHLHQIADKDHQGQISYPLLLELVQKSSAPFLHATTVSSLPPHSTIWCTYEDPNSNGQEMLIGSSEELQYAIQGCDDILHLKVQIAAKNDTSSADDTVTDTALIKTHLCAMEESLHEKLSTTLQQMETRLHDKLKELEQSMCIRKEPWIGRRMGRKQTTLPSAEGIVVPPSEALPTVQQETILSLCVGATENTTISDATSSTPTVAIAEVTTAECHWVQASNDNNSIELVTQNNDNDNQENTVSEEAIEEETSTPNASAHDDETTEGPEAERNDVGDDEEETNHDSNNIPATYAGHESHATVNRLDELAVTPEDLISNQVLPLLEKCLKRMSHYNDKRAKGVDNLKEDLEARASQLEEWNKTVLDGISAQTKVLKNRINDRTEKLVCRISQLEACCSDLNKQERTAAKKQAKVLDSIQKEQASLRQDIKILIKAIVKQADEEEDVSSVGSPSSASSSARMSVYTSASRAGLPAIVSVDPNQKEEDMGTCPPGMYHEDMDDLSCDRSIQGSGSVFSNHDSEMKDSLILYGMSSDGDEEEVVWKHKCFGKEK